MTYKIKTIDGKKYKLVPAEELQGEIVTLEVPAIKFEVYPSDAPKLMTWLEAQEFVDDLGDGWRLPTRQELQILCKNAKEIGLVIDENSSDTQWYWSGETFKTNYGEYAWSARASDGLENFYFKVNYRLSVRPVLGPC